MSSQQRQKESKRKRDPSPSSSSTTPDESGPTQPQSKNAKVNDDKKVDDDQLSSCGCSNSNDQLEQERAESKRECYICLEDFYDRNEEGIITACGHVFCLECLAFWVDWLLELEVEVRCPDCRGLVENVDDWSFDPLLEGA